MVGLDKDVTKVVKFEDNDGEVLPLTRCVCGTTWPAWEFQLGVYRDLARGCPRCGRRLYFAMKVLVFEVNGR